MAGCAACLSACEVDRQPPSLQTLTARWSFSYPAADFSAAGVVVKCGTSTLSLTKHAVKNGYGENTLSWDILQVGATTLTDSSSGAKWPKPASDLSCVVTVSGYKVAGVAKTATYTVKVFDPAK